MNHFKKLYKANLTICIEKILGFRVACAYFGVQAWKWSNMIWDALYKN